MRVGIVDLGSNTTRLIVFEVRDDFSFRLVEGLKDVIRLASGMDKEGCLNPNAIERAVEAAKLFEEFCRALDVDKILGVATAAVRRANNGAEVIQRIKDECGLNIRAISGEEEGELDYYGVINTMDAENAYLLDMGGASMELIKVKEREISSILVIPYGTIIMSEALYSSDSKIGLEVLGKDLKKEILREDFVDEDIDNLVGIGGTVRAIAKLDMKKKNYPLKLLHNYTMDIKDMNNILKLIEGNNVDEIIKKGVSESRADLILPGTFALKKIMEILNVERLRVSHSGIREGILYRDVLGVVGDPLGLSVRNMMSHYGVNKIHAKNVERIALKLFDLLRNGHGCGEGEKKLLSVTSMLHDVGLVIGYYNHGDPGCSIVLNEGINGLDHKSILKCALLIKLHTGSYDKKVFNGYKKILNKKDRRDILNLGVLLRIAESMDITESGLVRSVSGEIFAGALHLRVEGERKSIWRYGIERNAELFFNIYGLKLVVD